MNSTIRILIADDHTLMRKGLRALIKIHPDIEVVGEAADGIEAVQQTLALRPDVLLLDLVMPRMDGLEAISRIKQALPEARILILTSFSEDDRVFAAIKAGALGYLLKSSSPQELLEAIRAVHRGEPSLHPHIAFKLVRELNQPSDQPPTEPPLTARELEVLQNLARGLTNQEIAAKLFISERTVGHHVSHILSKLHLANRTQAGLYAVREGLTE